MKSSNWRAGVVAVISMAITNVGFMQAAQAGIVDTAVVVQTTRDANLATISTHLTGEDVRAQLTRFGVEASAIDQRLATMTDAELAQLADRMDRAPAGGDGLLAVIGLTFVVLIILELVGVIDIFKKS